MELCLYRLYIYCIYVLMFLCTYVYGDENKVYWLLTTMLLWMITNWWNFILLLLCHSIVCNCYDKLLQNNVFMSPNLWPPPPPPPPPCRFFIVFFYFSLFFFAFVLFVILYFFFWPLCCLSFGLRILIAPLVSSNSSWYISYFMFFIIIFGFLKFVFSFTGVDFSL